MKIIEAIHPAVRAIGRKVSTTLSTNVYIFAHNGIKYKLHIPTFYQFDGASIPRAAWSLIGLAPHGVMDGPALPHDFGYQYQGVVPNGALFVWDEYNSRWVPCTTPLSKKTFDLLLKELCVHLNAANKFQAAAVYAAVKAFGWFAWRRDDNARKLKQLRKEKK